MLRRAFTLVEMLIVMAILLVMVAMLLPAVAAVREQANSVVCQSHIKVLTQAFLAFASDHEGHLPGSLGSYYNYEANHKVVGWSTDSSGTSHPVLVERLDAYDWLFGRYWAINDSRLPGAGGYTNVDRLACALQCGTIWPYVAGTSDHKITTATSDAYAVYLCPSLTISAPEMRNGTMYGGGNSVGSNGRFDYAAFAEFSGASVKGINSTSYMVKDANNELIVDLPNLVPSPDLTLFEPMPTPLVCQEEPRLFINNNLEGQHAGPDQMAHCHHGGSYYGSPDGSVNFVIEPNNNPTVEQNGARLWWCQSSRGYWHRLDGDGGWTTAWWDCN